MCDAACHVIAVAPRNAVITARRRCRYNTCYNAGPPRCTQPSFTLHGHALPEVVPLRRAGVRGSDTLVALLCELRATPDTNATHGSAELPEAPAVSTADTIPTHPTSDAPIGGGVSRAPAVPRMTKSAGQYVGDRVLCAFSVPTDSEELDGPEHVVLFDRRPHP